MKSWKKHVIVLVAYVAASTPVTMWAYLYSPLLAALIESLTNTSNVIALAYAAYIYYLYDRDRL